MKISGFNLQRIKKLKKEYFDKRRPTEVGIARPSDTALKQFISNMEGSALTSLRTIGSGSCDDIRAS